MVTLNKLLSFSAICSLALISSVCAAEIEKPVAKMQAMDKITGRVNVIDIPVGGEVKFGSFSIVVRKCKTTPPEEAPENYAFVDVADSSFGMDEFNIFKGWMMSSSPALNAVEHPIYDVWLLKCYDGNVDKQLLLSDEKLKERDNLPKLADIKKTEDAPAAPEIQPEAQIEVPSPTVEEVKIEEAVIDTPQQTVEEISPEVPLAPVAAEEGGPQSLINLSDVVPDSEKPATTAPVTSPLEQSDEVDTTEALEVKELVVDAPAPTATIPAPLIAEEPQADETVPSSEVAPEEVEEESQFIDFSSEALPTSDLEAELSAEALKAE